MFSEVIRDLRHGRCLSPRQLSVLSGVSKATLSRWEAGVYLPRLPELTRVLDALDASSAERARCLHAFDAPRAVLALRRDPDAAVSLSLGDMLCGLRTRAGKTQADVARDAGVTRSLYARWEGDMTQPTADQLHRAAWATGASAEEAAVLLERQWAHVPLENTRDALILQYQTSYLASNTQSEETYGLQLLALLAHAGRLVRAGKAGTGDVGLVLSAFASNVTTLPGDAEAEGAYYRRALALAKASHEPVHFHLAGAVRSLLDERTNPRPRRERIAAARAWLPHFKTNAGRAYLLMFVAKEVAKDEPDEALRLADEYCALVAGDADEYPCRLHDRGKLLGKCGRPAESVAFIETLTPQDDYRAGLLKIELAKGLIALGSVAEARQCVDAAKRVLAPKSRLAVAPQIADLERDLG